jgi:hypothetical protein
VYVSVYVSVGVPVLVAVSVGVSVGVSDGQAPLVSQPSTILPLQSYQVLLHTHVAPARCELSGQLIAVVVTVGVAVAVPVAAGVFSGFGEEGESLFAHEKINRKGIISTIMPSIFALLVMCRLPEYYTYFIISPLL